MLRKRRIITREDSNDPNNEVQNSYLFDLTYDYFRGHKFTLGYMLKNYSYRYAFNMIPQNGYEIKADLSVERNQFDPSFEVSEDYGTLSLVFSNHDTYRFNASLKNNISIIKSKRIALNQKFDLGYVCWLTQNLSKGINDDLLCRRVTILTVGL